MKFKIVFTVALAIALVGGFYAGAYRERVAYDHFFMRSIYLRAALDTDRHVRVLTYLREGRTADALSTLETTLDSSLATFVTYDRAPPSERDDFVLRAIRNARGYRAEHPWAASSTNANSSAQDVLSFGK